MNTGDQHIQGTVGQANGDIDCEGDLRVDGNVLDGRVIRARGSIHVGGVVQAAQVTAGADLVAAGGILGRHKAHCIAEGNLTARYIARAFVKAGADIRIEGEIENSTVIAGGSILVPAGAIIGGQITAACSVSCRSVGVHHTRTYVEAGVDPAGEAEAVTAMARVAACRERAERIRTTVEPLLRLRKSLNAQQKERATELLFEANGMDAEIKQILDRLRENDQRLRLRAPPVIEVAEALHPGVRIRLLHLEATVEVPIRGRVTISLVDSGKNGQIVVTVPGGNATELKTRPAESKGAQILRQLSAA